MYSVTKVISMVKQPRGGYLNTKDFTKTQLKDNMILNEVENISSNLIGLVVDYMTRYIMGAKKEDAFAISLKGARCMDDFASVFLKKKVEITLLKAIKLLESIKGLDETSIINACKLVGFDVCYRSGPMGYKPVEEINPDKDTISNIIILINRSTKFWKKYGPIVKDGFDFEGGYTDTISSGDGDYLTKDTLWEFKVSKAEPTSKHTLQLLIYYIMGMHSIYKEFESIKKLGIYNPRLNLVYTIDIDLIPREVINYVEKKIICY